MKEVYGGRDRRSWFCGAICNLLRIINGAFLMPVAMDTDRIPHAHYVKKWNCAPGYAQALASLLASLAEFYSAEILTGSNSFARTLLANES